MTKISLSNNRLIVFVKNLLKKAGVKKRPVMLGLIALAAILIISGVAAVVLVKHSDNKQAVRQTTEERVRAAIKKLGPVDTSKAVNATSTIETNIVDIISFTFNPGLIKIKKGTAVTWTNKDSVAHDVVELDSQVGPKSNPLAKGASYSFTFNAVGVYKYHSSIHPAMKGTITVTE